MTLFYCIILLQFATTFAHGQIVQPSKPPRVPERPEAVVRSLYHVVVARHPIGLPRGADRKAIAPYLSKGLIRGLDTALACETDYSRLHRDPNVKSEIEWSEDGLLSGGNERALPAAYHVASTQPEKDDSFRVHVRLTYRDTWATYGRPPTEANTFQWYVDVIVVRENGHFVVDDVIYLKDEDDPRDVGPPLSQTLTLGCDGSRWVGYGEERNDF
jgi:hypothetical protein